MDACQITSFQRFQYSNRLCHQRIAISKRACAYNCSEQNLRGAVTPVTSATRTALTSSGRIQSHVLFTGSGRKIRSSRLWVLDTINSATQYNDMPPLNVTLWLFRNFDEEQPIMPEKTHIPLSAADVKRPRPYKTSEINIRLSIFATNEQYHQMCGRAITLQRVAA